MWVIPLALGFLLDLIIGDPQVLPHPVRLIGGGIERLERRTRIWFPETKNGQTAAGIFLAVVMVLLSFGIPLGILILLKMIHPLLMLAAETVMCYQILATKSLKTESMKVFVQLKNGTLKSARKAVSMIVGRDTDALNQSQIAKAAVETVAENTSDGTVAPMLFIALGGAPAGFLYKAINTMDSMVGYKNDRYLYYGKAAAKLDDIVNFIPARVSAVLMILAAGILRLDLKNAMRIFRRDRFHHASPNSAQTESVCAGALHIQLAGDAYYFGKQYEKQTIGDPDREIEYQDIKKANQLLYVTAVLCLVICLALRTAVLCLIGV